MQILEFAEVMAWLVAATGKAIADTEAERDARMDVYYECLGDLPANVLRIAAKRVAVAHPWSTFPSIAELRQAAAETMQGAVSVMSGGEAWQLAWRAAAKIDPEVEGSTERACNGLPPLVVEAMRNFGIVALTQADPNFARPQFIKIFEALTDREARHALLPASVKKAIAPVAEHATLPDKSPVKAIAGKIGSVPS